MKYLGDSGRKYNRGRKLNVLKSCHVKTHILITFI